MVNHLDDHPARSFFTHILHAICLVMITTGILVSASGEEPMPNTNDIPYAKGILPLSDGGQLAYYIREGHGPCLVLIPGSFGDHRVFDDFARALPSSLRLVVIELRGHGESQPPAEHATIELFAQDVLRVIDHLGIKRFYVGGHSIGGMIPIEIAGRRPDAVAGAIAMEGWTHHAVQAEAFGQHPPHTLPPELDTRNQANRARVLSRISEEQAREFATAWKRWDGLPILESTPVPILEIWGDRGHPRPSRQLLRIPNRPSIELLWMQGVGHNLHLEVPFQTAEATACFIERIETHQNPAATPTLSGETPDPARMMAVSGLDISPDAIDFSRIPRLNPDILTIYRAEQPEHGFNMHPYITHFDGRFWAMWSTNRIRDLQAGQHVCFATSADGESWSSPAAIMPREDEANLRYFARGFWIRGNQLYALAARDEAVRPLFGPGLVLLGYPWNASTGSWDAPIIIAQDAINNFPPDPLPSGYWMMSRRDHLMNKSMLRGGVYNPGLWESIAIAEPADGANLDEPIWWTLPNGQLMAAFRDGSRSRRLYRAISADDGLTWSPPVRTDFPDATAKFNVIRLKDGRYAMASNPNTSGIRIPICLSLSDDGIVFNRMAILRDAPTMYRYDGKDPGYAGYHYPQLLEHDSFLYIIHAENMEDILLMRIPIEALNTF